MTHLSPFEGTNLNLLLEDRARQRPDHPFLVWAPFEGPSRNWTYGQFATDAARLAGGLAKRGIGPGDRVLVHFENCPETLLARFALARLGAICVATNAMAAGPEITHYAGSSRATAAITQAKFAELVASHAPDVTWIAVADFAGPNNGDGSDSFDELLSRSGTGSPGAGIPTRRHHVHHRHDRKAEGRRVDAGECAVGLQIWRAGLRAPGEDVSLISLPLFHVVGLCWSFLPVLWAGGTAVLQPRFSASRFWPASLEHRATLASQVLFTSMALQSSRARAALLSPVDRRPRRQCIAGVQPDSRLRAVMGHDRAVAPGICGDPLSRRRRRARQAFARA